MKVEISRAEAWDIIDCDYGQDFVEKIMDLFNIDPEIFCEECGDRDLLEYTSFEGQRLCIPCYELSV
jgi:hypothetical protein